MDEETISGGKEVEAPRDHGGTRMTRRGKGLTYDRSGGSSMDNNATKRGEGLAHDGTEGRKKDADMTRRGEGLTYDGSDGSSMDNYATKRGEGLAHDGTEGRKKDADMTRRREGLAYRRMKRRDNTTQERSKRSEDYQQKKRWSRRDHYESSEVTSSEDELAKKTRRRGKSSTHRSRKRRHYSSSDSGDTRPGPSKRRPRSKQLSTNAMLDKFLDIITKVRSSDKPKLTFNTNVIPEFDPLSKEQTMLVWLTKVEECAEIYGWDDKATIHYALPKLSGVAKTWYQGLPTLMYTWGEWKKKLLESFPCREDYAELLTEMLSKKVKYGEPLEAYYYAKVNLLNRCKISGKRAVDCLLYGVEDRAIKVGAQAAQFSEPEQVLKYFRTVKVGQSKELHDASTSRYKTDRKSNLSVNDRFDLTKSGRTNPNIRCFNCDVVGHPSSKCDKPLIKCTNCNRIGHQAKDCFRRQITDDKSTKKDDKVKQVAELRLNDNSNSKYINEISINSSPITCHVDLGSQCSLIKVSHAKELGLQIVKREGLPALKGIGASIIHPLGVVTATVEVQGIKECIDLFVVDDYVISHPVLLGHSFTEKPNLLITKTPNDLVFQRIPLKVHLFSEKDFEIPSNTTQLIKIKAKSLDNMYVFVNGSLRGSDGEEYYLCPGEYELRNGCGALLVYNASPKTIYIRKDTLLTRAEQKLSDIVNTLQSCSIVFDEICFDTRINCGENISSTERLELQRLLSKYKNCFSSGLKDLGYAKTTEMVIELEDNNPVVFRPYRLSHSERTLVRGMVQEMLDSNIIRESSSPYASPIVLVQKKTGEKRLCVDYRALNRKTKKNHYPLPRVEDQLDMLSGSKLFTSVDLASGYYQIPISEESRDKTSFVTTDGQYEYNRMPFGLVNAPSVFQRTINKILMDAKIKYAIVYMDDVLIPAKTFEEGMVRLEEVLQLLQKGGLTLKLGKCNFFLEKIDFLGFEVSAQGIKPGTHKTEAVSKFPTPTNQHELRQFLGLSGFFRRFIKGYATIAAPLTDLLRKECTWTWGKNHEQAFCSLKEQLIKRPLLALYDPAAEIQLHTDASKEGIAGILLQRNADDIFHPISYFSRKTTTDEKKFHSYELETLAVVASLNRFRVYLTGVPFKILTDCNALRSTLTKRDLIPRIARWWVQIQEFDCAIEYRPGARMSHVDALSRNPVGEPLSETHVLDVLPVRNAEEDWITTVQSADEEVRSIKNTLEDPLSTKTVDIVTNYRVKNGRVYRVLGEALKWLVPKSVRWQILKMNHDDIGHHGFEKTLLRIQEHYWFAKMRKFVKKYVSSCLECAHHKAPGGKREGELHPIEKVSIPFHTVHADHLGPFVKSKKGNCYLLVLIDGFTKYINITPVRNTKSVTTVRVVREHISYFGVPTRLITDKGSTFTSATFKTFITSYGIKHIVNAVSTPRANGQVERFNRTILDALSASGHGKDDKSWDDSVGDIQVGINTTKHKTTQKSPSELLFGFNIVSRSEGIMSSVIHDTLNRTPVDELEDLREEASQSIKRQQDKDKERFNRHRKTVTNYKVGDLVRVERHVPHDGKSQKLVNKYQGPYRVMKVLPHNRFLIEDTPLTRKGSRYEAVVAVDKIQPWLMFSRNFESDYSDDDNEEVNT